MTASSTSRVRSTGSPASGRPASSPASSRSSTSSPGEAAPGRPWSVGVAHPLHPGDLTTLVRGRDLGGATSGTAERGHHIVDPHSGRPASGPVSITLVGWHLTEVDAMATAAFAMGHDARGWIQSLDGIEAFAVTADVRVWWTPGFAEHGLIPARG
ncbi:FAD:protein FMN transferase [Streptomyces sp. NPDC019443]|uniref:FAD:protein FMN transferase n=1 Tax=Streptomyces sp. NPDC019443 TaxID=3365061 RepID=UPI0037A66FEB